MIPTTSPFLDRVPPEIRLQIYSYLLVAPTPIKGTIARSFQNESYHLHTSILRTNKQIYNEAKYIFFGLNTFHITSAPSLSGDDSSSVPGSFEPPLQLRDLPLIRHLRIDPLYVPSQVHVAVTREGNEWMSVCTGADRYATSLGFLLSTVKKTLLSLEFVADSRPYTSYDCDANTDLEELDVKSYLTGFCAADRNWRFRDALADMAIRRFGLKFDFPESVFELSVNQDVLVDKKLVVLAGQVLVARSELRLRTAVGERDQGHGDLQTMKEQKCSCLPAEEIVVPWPFLGTPERKDLSAELFLERK